MRIRLLLAALAVQLLFVNAALAEPASGPREDLNQSFTAKRPSKATGLAFTAHYHAAGDPKGNPPFLRDMTFYPPRGFRYDTSVPDRCTATDAQLAALGPAACPAGARLGGGTTDGIFFYPFSDQIFDRFHHNLHILNNANEQIILVESEGYTVQRGKMRPDGSIDFQSTTCFPAPPAGVPCADDYIMQLANDTLIPRYVKDGHSYATTPPRCPSRHYWRTKIHFEWTDGSVDDVVSRQPCKPRRR
jgi:hypothetical protein